MAPNLLCLTFLQQRVFSDCKSLQPCPLLPCPHVSYTGTEHRSLDARKQPAGVTLTVLLNGQITQRNVFFPTTQPTREKRVTIQELLSAGWPDHFLTAENTSSSRGVKACGQCSAAAGAPGATPGITAHVAALHQHLVGQKTTEPQLGRSTECLSSNMGPRHALLLLGLYNEWLSVTCYWPCTFTNIQKSGSLCSKSLLHQVSYNIQLCVYKYTWNNTYCKYISIYTLISIHIQN